MEDLKVDLVYLWVDGSDKEWFEKKCRYLKELKNIEIEGTDDSRFVEHDELKYSLRSAEKNAPWINHIYIVTDNQVPKWLDTSNSKITIVDHKEIFDSEDLPVFNSMAIEVNLHKIPGLAEHFLYANDDFFINRPVEKSFFFDKNRKPICRFSSKLKRNKLNDLYRKNIYYTHSVVSKTTGKKLPYLIHHNIDSYTKSNFIDCEKAFPKEFEKVRKMKFRDKNAFERTGVHYYAVMTGAGTFKRVPKRNALDYILAKFGVHRQFESMYFGLSNKEIKTKILSFKPCLFCINDGVGVQSEEVRNSIKNLYAELFPNKSSFEL